MGFDIPLLFSFLLILILFHKATSIVRSSVLVSHSCCNEVPQTGVFKEKFILSQF